MIIKNSIKRLSNKLLFLSMILLVSNIGIWRTNVSYIIQNTNFCITVLDIGQGDSILLKTNRNKFILVDSGKENFVLEKIQEVLPYNFKKIDLLILTHVDADHIEGTLGLIKSYEIGKIYLNLPVNVSPLLSELLHQINERGIPLEKLYSKDDFFLDGIFFNTLWPEEESFPKISKDTNNASIAIKLTYGITDIFMGGDLPSEFEDQLSAEIEDIEILKAGHHGSKTSTSKSFLNKLKPEISIISAGLNNSYGHPHAEVLNNLQEENSSIFRTDLDGNIKLELDGKNINIETSTGKKQHFLAN